MSKLAKEDAVQNLVNSLGGDFPAKYAAWRAKNSARKGTLLKAPKPRKPAPARVPDRIIMNCTVQ